MIGTEEGHKDGCGAIVRLQELRAKMRECQRKEQVMSCVSAEDEVTGSNQGFAGGFSGGEARG